MWIIGLALYCIGMIVTDKTLANGFVEGIEEGYDEEVDTMSVYTGRVMYLWATVLIIFGKIVIPLLWPIVWGVSIILVIKSKEEKA